jgi:hypothetical protein
MRIEVYTGENRAARDGPRLIGWLVQLPDGSILLEVGPPDGPGGDNLQWLRAAVQRSGGWPVLGDDPLNDAGIELRNISGTIEGRVVPDAGDYPVLWRDVMQGPPDEPLYVPVVKRD